MHLAKHHGLGNDFLVLIDLDDRHPIDADVAVAVCDRHRGVGADGLIRVTRGVSEPFRMELRNGDGSRAEMSGNGISCLAQALVRGGHVDGSEVRITTDAGLRVVTVVEARSDVRHRMSVAMGTPELVPSPDRWLGGGVVRAVAVDMGNPHLVCLVDDWDRRPDLVALGERANREISGGTNVEVCAVTGEGVVTMEVYERGVGPTQACGTGAVATAAAVGSWGLSDAQVRVVQPGGPAEVDLSGGDGQARLTVPVVAVADVRWLG